MYDCVLLKWLHCRAHAVQPDAVSGLSVVQSTVPLDSATLHWTSPDDIKTILFRVAVRSLADNSLHVSSAVSVIKWSYKKYR